MGGTLQLGKAQYGLGLAADAGSDRNQLEFIFGGVRCVLRGLGRDLHAMSVCRKSNRLQSSVWDGKIDETKIGWKKSEKS